MIAAPQRETDILPLVKPHTVVALDDEVSTLAALRRSLRGEPYDLLTAEDPQQVLSWIAIRDVSIVISDQRMPDMEGTELLVEVRQRSPRTTGVILTAYPESLRMDSALKSLIRWVILKPWDDLWLRRTVRHLLRERELSRFHDSKDSEGFEPDVGGES